MQILLKTKLFNIFLHNLHIYFFSLFHPICTFSTISSNNILILPLFYFQTLYQNFFATHTKDGKAFFHNTFRITFSCVTL